MGGSRRAAWSVVFGALGSLTIPVAIAATRYSGSYELLHAGFAIPVAVAFGSGAVVLARSARARGVGALARPRGGRSASVGRFLGILGLCIAGSATIAVAVYYVLVTVE